MLDILKKLTEITAPSGSESLLYDMVKSEISPFVDEITVSFFNISSISFYLP